MGVRVRMILRRPARLVGGDGTGRRDECFWKGVSAATTDKQKRLCGLEWYACSVCGTNLRNVGSMTHGIQYALVYPRRQTEKTSGDI